MTGSKWQWLLKQMTRKLWVRTSLFALLAVVTALISIVLNKFITLPPTINVSNELLNNILNILATSMLAVTTFSLNIMVSAYSAASAGVTPRATKLLMEDSTTQNALATFLGSFLFSLVGIIALGIGAYHEQAQIYLFIVTMVVSATYVSDDPMFAKSFINSLITVALCSLWPTLINTAVGVT
ncbi:hypothetical protein HC02_00590, partial [Vibrio parahaemolyticus]